MNDLVLFDYASLEAGAREYVIAAAERVRVYGKRAAESIVKIGEELVEVKDRLGHGNFLRWLNAEFGWSEPTAQNFMRVSDMVKNVNFTDLPSFDISALYLLARPSTPAEVRAEAIAQAASGQRVTHASVIEMKQRVRERMGWSGPSAVPKPLLTWEDAGFADEQQFSFEAEIHGWLSEHPLGDPEKLQRLVRTAKSPFRERLGKTARDIGTTLLDLAEDLDHETAQHH